MLRSCYSHRICKENGMMLCIHFSTLASLSKYVMQEVCIVCVAFLALVSHCTCNPHFICGTMLSSWRRRVVHNDYISLHCVCTNLPTCHITNGVSAWFGLGILMPCFFAAMRMNSLLRLQYFLSIYYFWELHESCQHFFFAQNELSQARKSEESSCSMTWKSN